MGRDLICALSQTSAGGMALRMAAMRAWRSSAARLDAWLAALWPARRSRASAHAVPARSVSAPALR